MAVSPAEASASPLFSGTAPSRVVQPNAPDRLNAEDPEAVYLDKDSDEFGTPGYIFDPLHREFGFTLDAAASYKNTKLSRYITKERDALSEATCWRYFEGGVADPNTAVWCNPPYSRNLVEAFVRKAYRETCVIHKNQGLVVVMLLPARTEQPWFHDIVLPYAEVRFVRKRVRFVGGKTSARFPSLVAIFPKHRRSPQEVVGDVVAALEPRCVA